MRGLPENIIFHPINSRALLQNNVTQANSTSTAACSSANGIGCLLFNLIATAFALAIALIIIGIMLYRKLKYKRAVNSGKVPAKMLLSRQRYLPVEEQGDIDAFDFYISRPNSKEEIADEESCPICFKTSSSKPNKWIVTECKHYFCDSCFKKLVVSQRLHASCPMCRSMLAKGEGNRGGPKKREQEDRRTASTSSNSSTEPAPATTTVPASAAENAV